MSVTNTYPALPTLMQCRNAAEKQLGQKRFYHSCCVQQAAAVLAAQYGVDENKAAVAGMLHDIMKDAAPEKQLKLLAESGIMLSYTENRSPALWHAYSGAVYLHRTLGICDSDIYRAVYFHTTGRPNMTLLEKIIFVADFVSEDRTFDGAQELRGVLAAQGLDAAVKEELRFTVQHLRQKNLPVAGPTQNAYAFYTASEINTATERI